MKTLAVSTTLMSALLIALSAPQSMVDEIPGVRQQQGHVGDLVERDRVWYRASEERLSNRIPAERFKEDQAVIEEYCVRCHSERRLRGNLSLETFDVSRPESLPAIAEAMIVKLRAGMMPPPGAARPQESALVQLAAGLEARMDLSLIHI